MVISRRQAASIGSVFILFVLFADTKAQTNNETQAELSAGVNSTENTTTSGNMSISNASNMTTTAASTTATGESTTATTTLPMSNSSSPNFMNPQHPVSSFPPSPPPPPPVPGMMVPGQEGNQHGMMDHSGMGHSPMPGGMNESGTASGPQGTNEQFNPNSNDMGTSTSSPQIVNVNNNENLDKTKYDVLSQAGRNADDSSMSHSGPTVGYTKEIGSRPSANPHNSANHFGFESHLLIATLLTFFYHLKVIF